jgi:hypothetical protein
MPPKSEAQAPPTRAAWVAHGMVASWPDLTALARNLLLGGALYPEASLLRRSYQARVIEIPFQGAGCRLVRSGASWWAGHGGQWAGHTAWIAFGRDRGIVAHAGYREPGTTVRRILRLLLDEYSAGESTDVAIPSEDHLTPGSVRCESQLAFAGPVALSMAARCRLGSSISLMIGEKTGMLRTWKEHRLSPVASARSLWRYTFKGEERLLHCALHDGRVSVVLERPLCILTEVP